VAVVLRLHEIRDVPDRTRPDPAAVERLRAAEDQVAHNAFAAVGFLKPGTFRAVLSRIVLFAISYGVRHVLNRGSLAGVKTIHFARWVYLTPERMIFLSAYDGSLESYMDDFIDKVAWGLNAIFSNGIGYPPTVLLLWGGARREDLFKDHLRNHQALNHVWWSAYDELTALNVGSPTATAAARPGPAAPPPITGRARGLDRADVQGLVGSGYGRLPEALFLGLQVVDGAAGRALLADLLPDLTTMAGSREGRALNVAISHAGLARLGVPEEALAGFSLEFAGEMVTPTHSAFPG
jgi:hypothetical protein